MNYRRALFVAERGKDAHHAISLLRVIAPELEHLLVLVPVPSSIFAPWAPEPSPEREDEAAATLEALRTATLGAARSVDLELAPVIDGDALDALSTAAEIDLIVFASRSFTSASLASQGRKRMPVSILWAEGEASGPVRNVVCVVPDARARAAVGAFLRDHADGSMHVALISPTALAPDMLPAFREVSGIAATLESSSPLESSSVGEWLDTWRRSRPVDLLVFAGFPSAVLLGGLRPTPILLVPQLPVPWTPDQHTLDLPDLLDGGEPIRVRVDQISAVGTPSPLSDQTLSFVAGGRVVSTFTTSGGEAELPSGLPATTVGVCRVAEGAPVDPLAAIERRVTVVRPGASPLVVFDAELPDATLRGLAEDASTSGRELLAVRLRPTRACRAIRVRLRALGLSPRVVDARAVLDEGEALDVSDALDAVRLARVATRLARSGFPVVALLHGGRVPPEAPGIAVLGGAVAESHPGAQASVAEGGPAAPASTEGNRIELELDNGTARRWLLEAIGRSQRTLHLQVYMGLDDEVGHAVEQSLAAAAARGVRVRVLVDSLHGLHGSFGVKNPVFERLSGRPHVELRTLRPITEVPSLADLKQRDHRKLVIADGALALLGGRNLSHEYYMDFAEVPLTAASTWRDVPWLDGGARVEGPAVEALSASFLDAWTGAGGAPFPVEPQLPAGTSPARVVVHRGLRDARTLEAYLELIDGARSQVRVVNGFPLLLELQHALLRALRRGVRVRALIGHLTPTHDGHPFGGPWSGARLAATQLVHSRMDPIVAAGGEVFLFARRDVAGWAPQLGTVHPHVHAKALSVDGLRCSVGSANLDVTSSYWESELLLIADDPALAGPFEARIDALMADSVQITSDDPAWKQLSRRRAWMRHWPGTLSI